jgi:hypothetical protein
MRAALRLAALIASFICVVSLPSHAQTKSTKRPLPPPLPFGRTGLLPQLPLDSMPPEPPQVNYHDGQLTIISSNSTLADILRCVRKETAAEIEIPAVTERVVTHLGPGPVSDILSELLNGSHFNYILLGSSNDPSRLGRVVLLAKTPPDLTNPAQPSVLKRAPPTQSSSHVNSDQARTIDQGGLENESVVPPSPEVTSPAQTDVAVEVSD